MPVALVTVLLLSSASGPSSVTDGGASADVIDGAGRESSAAGTEPADVDAADPIDVAIDVATEGSHEHDAVYDEAWRIGGTAALGGLGAGGGFVVGALMAPVVGLVAALAAGTFFGGGAAITFDPTTTIIGLVVAGMIPIAITAAGAALGMWSAPIGVQASSSALAALAGAIGMLGGAAIAGFGLPLVVGPLGPSDEPTWLVGAALGGLGGGVAAAATTAAATSALMLWVVPELERAGAAE